MKINKIRWQNFRGLADGEIVCNGRNVVISGRNGVGKSSIMSILPFILRERIQSKAFDERGFVIESQMPTASIEFDNVTLSRTVNTRGQNLTFVNGDKASATKFDSVIGQMTGNLYTLLFDPFEFPTSHWQEQRDVLLRRFVKNEDINVSGGESVLLKEKIKSLKSDLTGIPYQMQELQKQLDGAPEDNLDELLTRLDKMQTEFNTLRPFDSEREEKLLRARIDELSERREQLKVKYKSLDKACPTCGQKLPDERLAAAQKQVVTLGKKCAAELEKARDDLETLTSQTEFDAEKSMRMRQLSDEIRELAGRVNELRNLDKIRARLVELTEREKSLNARLTEVEGELAALQKQRQDKIVAFEQKINSQFRFVKFRLFKILASGELKADCVAMLDGVPFPNLSKGERLKAALDILLTFQTLAKLEMPLFLDDAESYTSNSFVELPNQKFLFKVTDSDLKIEVL